MRTLAQHPLFWLGLLIRLVLAPFFASHYMSELFIPFIDQAIVAPWANPWDGLSKAHFPYGAFLFLILWLPKFALYQIFGQPILGTGALSLLVTKLPLLCVECVLLRTMVTSGLNVRRTLIYFWMCPIVIYITYVHGQMDVVMVTCVYLCFTWLQSRRLLLSAFAMACALGSKFSAAFMIPLGIAYIWHREFSPKSWRDVAIWLIISVAVAALFFAPLMAAESLGYATFGSPEAMRLLAARITLGQNSDLYIGPALLIGALFWLCLGSRMTSEGLFLAGGFVFGILLLTTQAMPGWYMWALPMLALLHVRYPATPVLPWHLFNLLYLANFTGILDILVGNHSQIPWGQILFTLLQTVLALILVMVWFVALRLEARPQSLVKPLVIGIAGDSGVGKDRLSRTLMDCFSQRHTAIMHGDDYHKWERGDIRYKDVTHLSPKANHLRTMGTHAKSLIQGRTISVRHYDHHSGHFSDPQEYRSKRTLIIQGLHALYLRGMRRNLDLRIFLAPHESLQIAWKVERDVKQRGSDPKSVLRTIEKRRSDALAHIAPQRTFADWIIEALPKTTLTAEQIIKGNSTSFYVRHIVWNDIDLEPITLALQEIPGIFVKLETLPDDLDRTVLLVDGELTKAHIESLAAQLFPSLRYITRSSTPPQWHSGFDGLAQLLALILLQDRLDQRHEAIDDDFYQTPRQSDQGRLHFKSDVGS